jgi:hypothetical protein
VSILLGYENGTFHAPESYPIGINPRFVAAGDFNGDGFPDLAVATEFNVIVLLNAADWSGAP